MLRGLMLMEAIHSSALSCGCGTCTACLASDGDEDALARVFLAAALDDASAAGAAASSKEQPPMSTDRKEPSDG